MIGYRRIGGLLMRDMMAYCRRCDSQDIFGSLHRKMQCFIGLEMCGPIKRDCGFLVVCGFSGKVVRADSEL
jgi:hypothetical protein